MGGRAAIHANQASEALTDPQETVADKKKSPEGGLRTVNTE